MARRPASDDKRRKRGSYAKHRPAPPLLGPLTPQEFAEREAEARLRARYGFTPSHMGGQGKLVGAAEHEGTPDAHEGQTLVDGRWVCRVPPPPNWPRSAQRDADPYESEGE